MLKGMEKEYRAMFHDLEKLKFADTPNYAWYRQQLKTIMARRGYTDEDPLDWEEGGPGYESVLKSAVAADPYKKKERADKHIVKERVEGEEKSDVEEA